MDWVAIITAALGVAQTAASLFTNSSQIGSVITMLEKAVPAAVQFGQDAFSIVENTITALRSNGNVTADQLAQLDALETQYDAAYDQVSAKDAADDAAASGSTANPPATTGS